MSGGGSSPSAPNLSGNIGNANKTFDTATSNAQQTMNTAVGYNANAQKTLQNVTGAQTGMMNKVNDTANQNLQTYGNTFVPLQQQQADFAKNYTSDQNIQNLQGRAVADQNSQLDSQLANQRRELASEGVDPASVHGQGLEQQARVMGAANAAGASNSAYTNAQLTGAGLVNQANQLGLNVGAAGTQGAQTAAGIGASQVGEANQTNSSGISNLTAGNTYLNTAVGANKSASDIADTQFQDQAKAYQMQQASGPMSQIGAIAGGVMKAYTGGFSEGGVVPGGAIPTPSYATGGPVSPRGALPASPIPGSTDTKPALLTPGEFVIPADVAAWKGHEHWYKQLDKAREEMATRHGALPSPSSVHTARGH